MFVFNCSVGVPAIVVAIEINCAILFLFLFSYYYYYYLLFLDFIFFASVSIFFVGFLPEPLFSRMLSHNPLLDFEPSFLFNNSIFLTLMLF